MPHRNTVFDLAPHEVASHNLSLLVWWAKVKDFKAC